MINLNESLKIRVDEAVKPFRIHKVIHSFCGKLWKSPKDKHLGEKVNLRVQTCHRKKRSAQIEIKCVNRNERAVRN